MKTKINMRCTQEQFEAIKPKLVGMNFNDALFDLEEYPYLTNNYRGCGSIGIGSRPKDMIGKDDGIIVETWDEQVFLEACGIETEKVFRGSELQYRNSRTGWVDCGNREYRIKPTNYDEIEALKAQKLAIEKQIELLSK